MSAAAPPHPTETAGAVLRSAAGATETRGSEDAFYCTEDRITTQKNLLRRNDGENQKRKPDEEQKQMRSKYR